MGYENKILYTVWGIIQLLAMMQLGIGGENTWIIIGLVVSNIGMMCLINSLSEKVEETKE